LSSEKITAPRGTFDVLGEQAAIRTTLEAKARALLESAGYERIETPAFEASELFARGVGDSTDIVRKEMYSFEDRSGRSLTLRPEGTAPVCRAYLEHGMHKRPAPVKLWYLSSFFRYERSQSGRYRQFWQVGAEALGSEDPALDAESIVLLAKLLEQIGVADVRLRLSSLGSHEVRTHYREALREHLHQHEAELSEQVRERIDLNPLRAFDSDHPGTRQVMSTAPLLLEHLSDRDGEHFGQVRELLDVAGVSYEVDPTLVRGLDYYTHTVFEFTSEALGAQSGVGGGGRYDGLVEELGGPHTPGIGWAAGIERMLLAATGSAPASPVLDLFIALEQPDLATLRASAFEVMQAARGGGLHAQMELAGRSLKGQLKQADRLGARYVAIVQANDTNLKDMQSGFQQTIATDTIVHTVLRGLREIA
jgi:histidyl-tRNA synthetase